MDMRMNALIQIILDNLTDKINSGLGLCHKTEGRQGDELRDQ